MTLHHGDVGVALGGFEGVVALNVPFEGLAIDAHLLKTKLTLPPVLIVCQHVHHLAVRLHLQVDFVLARVHVLLEADELAESAVRFGDLLLEGHRECLI